MLTAIPTDSENVLALSATGKVSGDDYETVLIPAFEAALAKYKKVRLLYQLGAEFEGFEGHAMWDDAKVGMRHLTDFEKIAVVTDEKSMERMVRALGFLMPCEVRLYANDEHYAAMDWIVE